jgi:hypothetical protein
MIFKQTHHKPKYLLTWTKGNTTMTRAYSNYEWVMVFSKELIFDGFEISLKLNPEL